MTEEKKPLLIQIDGEVREMTSEECEALQALQAEAKPIEVPE